MKEPRVAMLIRIPASLKARLADIAKRDHRSLNQEIEFLLDLVTHGEMTEEKQDGDTKRVRR